LIGRGGMASVYRAKDDQLGRSVAIKVFPVSDETSADLGRETSEIRLLASLNHHALVTLFDASVDADAAVDRAFLVMELVEGPTLRERIDTGPIGEADVAMMTIDLAEALHVVHASGVVHRDIKPANILLNPSASPTTEFRAKLTDFGIAYLIDSTRLTTPGTVIGTAAYLSPEQARGDAPGSASDIYSLGLVILEALTGTKAFEGTMIESLSARLVNDPAVPGSVGGQWRSLLTAMTVRDPALRPTALEVAELARAIERSLYSEAGAGAGAETATMVMTDTPTAVMTDNTTSTHDNTGATKLLPAPDAPTERLQAKSAVSAPAAPASGRPGIRRRVIVAVIAVAAILLIVVVAVTLGGRTEPTAAPTLAPNEGELGTHLEQLLESVTP
jgi:serine/threonine protein kinase